MNAANQSKLKTVLDAVPTGYLVDAQWLTSRGIAYETFRDYVKRDWLERISRGVFRRPVPAPHRSDVIDWTTCLLSLQHIMQHEVHVGAATALSRQGHDHYLRLGTPAPVWVYGDALPPWLNRLPLNAPLQIRKTSLFSGPSYLGLSGDPAAPPGGLPGEWELRTSMPERAILEALDEVPRNESFHTLDMIFEGLTTLRPKVLSALLTSCTKIKVKRLFFVFADRHDHPWRNRLDHADYDLGSGDRALFKGGRLHPTYRIMVPEEFVTARPADGP